MGRHRSPKLTPREAAIMAVLWARGEATAEQVREGMAGPDAPHDSTVRTLLRVLESKGLAAHERRGRAFVYRPLVDRGQAQKTALRDLLGRFFGGSAGDLVLRMIEDEPIRPDELDAISKAVQAARDAATAAPTSRRRTPKTEDPSA